MCSLSGCNIIPDITLPNLIIIFLLWYYKQNKKTKPENPITAYISNS
jgi:hypothetical protein